MLQRLIRFSIVSVYIVLVACSSITEQSDRAPSSPKDVSAVPNAIPKDEPRSKYGNPASYKVLGKRYYTLASSEGYHEKGIASWYGAKFHGRRTSSGELYDMYAMTAAHKTLPLPTYVEVTNLSNGRKVIVKVNDRGPFHSNRLIDLSYSAAKQLGIMSKGTGMVEIRAISAGETNMQAVAHVQQPVVDTQVGLYLQVGAFSTSTRAQQFKDKIQSQISDLVSIVPLVKPDGNLYRVRVGPLTTVEYGDSLASHLLDLGFNDAHIVVE